MAKWKDFYDSSEIFIIAELANNHSGQTDLAKKMIIELSEIKNNFDLNIIVKFQYRDLDTYIDNEFKGKQDYKFIKRFESTRLEWGDFLSLADFAKSLGLMTAATPFDEPSVEKVKEHGHDILKVASATSTDWNLLEKCVSKKMPMVVSLGGLDDFEVDRVVSFLKHRDADFALMHCVALYPTSNQKLNLKKIREIKERYRVLTGFSTHEDPKNLLAGPLALAAGAQIFEKHYAKKYDEVEINSYSSEKADFEAWIKAILSARAQLTDFFFRDNLGVQRMTLRPLKRGLYASRDIQLNEIIDVSNTYFAIPVQEGQFTSNELSLRTSIIAQCEIKKGQAVNYKDCKILNKTKNLEIILSRARFLISKSGLTLGSDLDVEISHHYGIQKFEKFGAILIPLINREYAKKLVVMFKGQIHPEHYHKLKEETFIILIGKLRVTLDGIVTIIEPGDVLLIPRTRKHFMEAIEDTVFEEISSTNFTDDSFYTQPDKLVPARKTPTSLWF